MPTCQVIAELIDLGLSDPDIIERYGPTNTGAETRIRPDILNPSSRIGAGDSVATDMWLLFSMFSLLAL